MVRVKLQTSFTATLVYIAGRNMSVINVWGIQKISYNVETKTQTVFDVATETLIVKIYLKVTYNGLKINM